MVATEIINIFPIEAPLRGKVSANREPINPIQSLGGVGAWVEILSLTVWDLC